jgi:hypothetical protein
VCLPALEAAEQYADGLLDEKTCVGAASTFDGIRRSRFPKYPTPDDEAWRAVYCAVHRRWETRYDKTLARDRWRLAGVAARSAASGTEEIQAQADLLRDIFGNLFRPVTLHPDWLTPTVAGLAIAAYEDRSLPSGALDPVRLSVLGDALEDAGCSEDILDHCRQPGEHIRACWVIDLLTNRK